MLERCGRAVPCCLERSVADALQVAPKNEPDATLGEMQMPTIKACLGIWSRASLYEDLLIDFIDFKVWPVFNLADSAIVVGSCILAFYFWRSDEEACASSIPAGREDGESRGGAR